MTDASGRFFAGIALEETTDAATVAAVLPGGDAEEEGILPGDVIKIAQGLALKSTNASSWPWALASQTEGELLEAIVLRGDEEITFVVETRDLLIAPDGV